jgi:hypothetical protein
MVLGLQKMHLLALKNLNVERERERDILHFSMKKAFMLTKLSSIPPKTRGAKNKLIKFLTTSSLTCLFPVVTNGYLSPP